MTYHIYSQSGDIVWPDEDTKLICGDVEDWEVGI